MDTQNITAYVLAHGFDTWSTTSVNTIVSVLIALFAAYSLYIKAFTPMDRMRTLEEVGWNHLLKDDIRNRTMAEAVRNFQHQRKIGNLPPVYPNGWFSVMDSMSLKIGEVRSVSVLGETLAVFRTSDGKVRVLDAHCPHLGANMAVGGIVKANELECPFHGWKFDGKTGKCSDIPYSNKVPECVRVRSWDSCEINGSIFIWYHSDRIPPTYQIPKLEKIQSGIWSYRGRTEHEVAAHIQEIPENGADLAHLGHLHVPNILKGVDLSLSQAKHKILDLICHHWDAKWAVSEEESHVVKIELQHSLQLFKRKFSLMDMKISIKQIGPSLVHMFFNTCFGQGVLIQTVTPTKPLCQRVVHRFYTSSFLITPLAKLIMLAEALHVERDVMIWNSKQYMSQPLFVSEDKLIPKFRKWYSQFYSETSPTIESLRNNLEW